MKKIFLLGFLFAAAFTANAADGMRPEADKLQDKGWLLCHPLLKRVLTEKTTNKKQKITK